MSDDFVVNVKQIAQYPQVPITGPSDRLLLQQAGVGGPYVSMSPSDAVATALELGGYLRLAPNAGGIAFNGSTISFATGAFQFTEPLQVPSLVSAGEIFVNDQAVATQQYVTSLFDVLFEQGVVRSFNGRDGLVQLQESDILQAGGILQNDPHFTGTVLAPTFWDFRDSSDRVATTAWVQGVIGALLCSGSVVTSFNGRGGAIVLSGDDITIGGTAPGSMPRANTPVFGDISNRIATTEFVQDAVDELHRFLQGEIDAGLSTTYAPLDSPNFTGIPTGPTANPGTTTGQLATTAFVQAAVVASTTGVSTWNGRSGAVTFLATDITGVGGALLASPAFTGSPTAPTQAPGANDTKLATTAFVHAAVAAVAAGVTSFNARTGAVTLTLADVTGVGGAQLASPAFSGTPTAPTPGPTTNTTQIATTAFVQGLIAGIGAVTSFNSRTGAVTLLAADVSAAGGALVNSPTFTGNPQAPTPAPGDNDTSIATTAFVAAAVTAASAGVVSFNGRTGAVTLTSADVTSVGGALLASPTFTGVPAGPTPTPGDNSTKLATTAFVTAAMAAAPGGVSSFNSRTGAITLIGADVSAAGGALTASPTFTGTPKAPTQAPGDNTTNLATTAFVAAAIASSGGVTTFNGRAGAVTLNATDIFGAGGALYLQQDTAPAVATNNTLWFDSIGGQLYVRYIDPSTSAKSWVIANSPQPQAPASGSRVLITAVDITTPVTSIAFFNGFDGTYDLLELYTWDLLPASEQQLYLQVSTDGSTFDSGTNYYYATTYTGSNSSTPGGAAGANQTLIQLGTVTSTAGVPQLLRMLIHRPPANTARFLCQFHHIGVSSVALASYSGGGEFVPYTAAVVGIRLGFGSSPNITRGSLRLYGIVK